MQLKSIVYSWRRNKAFLLVNFAGLSIGLMVTILLFLFAYNELIYDKWMPHSSKIVRINTSLTDSNSSQFLPVTSRQVFTDLQGKIPGMVDITQFFYEWRTTEMSYEEKSIYDINFIYSEANFFNVFDFDILEGNKADMLEGKENVVICKSLADNLFPGESAIGKIVKVGNRNLTVTGVMQDLLKNSHMKIDAIFSLKTYEYITQLGGASLNLFTYFRVDDQSDVDQVSKLVADEYTKMVSAAFKQHGQYEAKGYTMPITDIYLKSKTNYELNNCGSLSTVLILISVAMLILVLAITNFINMFLVQSKNRSGEIGIRKVNGASHGAITKLFFNEVGLVVFLAGIAGYAISYSLIPGFTNLVGKQIEQSLFFDIRFIAIILGVMIVTIVLSISYPSSILSRMNPVEIIKKIGSSSSKHYFSNAVVIFQSAITILLIAFVLIINKQTRYLQDMPKGYNPNNIMTLVATTATTEHFDALQADLLATSGIKAVSRTAQELGGIQTVLSYSRYGEDTKSSKTINNYTITYNYCEMMGLELAEGEFFKKDDPNAGYKILLNETAAKSIFPDKSALNQRLVFGGNTTVEIIGIVKDFCYDSPGKEIKPLMLTYAPPQYSNVICIKFDEFVSKHSAAKMVEPIVKAIDPTFVFNPRWAEDIYNDKFASEEQLFRIIFTGSILAIIIAVLGLVAIHSFTIGGRVKEVGIRKVVGSTIPQIIVLLSKNVIMQTIVASVVALPLAWIIGARWLSQYSSHTNINIWVLAVPLLIQIIVSIATTLYISYKAATRNPVEILRSE